MMTEEELSAMVVPAARDAILFMWVTMANWPMCIRVLRAWGFTYVGPHIIWLKHASTGTQTFSGIGAHTASNIEILVMGRRGDIAPGLVPAQRRLDTYQKVVHSVKPSEVHDEVLRVCAEHGLGRPLEMFARCTTRPGFDFGVGDQQALYAGMSPDEVAAHARKVLVPAPAKAPRATKKAKVVAVERQVVDNPASLYPDQAYVITVLPLTTPANLARLDIAAALAPDSLLVVECSAETLEPAMAVFTEQTGVVYKTILFYAYAEDDLYDSRFFMVLSPPGSSVKRIRKAYLKQTVDATGLCDLDRFNLVMERVATAFGHVRTAVVRFGDGGVYTVEERFCEG